MIFKRLHLVTLLVFRLISAHSLLAQSINFELLNTFEVPAKIGEKNLFIGISGLVYSQYNSILYAVSDDSGYNKPNNDARMFDLSLSVQEGKVIGKLRAGNPIYLKDEQNHMMKHGELDLEGIAFTRDGKLLIVSEQDINGYFEYPPKLYLFNKTGTLLKTFNFPKKFSPTGTVHAHSGCVRNKCFEGLSRIPSQDHFVAIVEKPLVQEKETELLRFLKFSLPSESDKEIHTVEEYAYKMDSLEKALTDGNKKISVGVSDLLALNEVDFLTIERSYIQYNNKPSASIIRVYKTQCNKCTDIKSNEKILDANQIKPMEKELVLDLSKVQNLDGKYFNFLNIEGISWGPYIDGHPTIIFANDNTTDSETANEHIDPTYFMIFKTNL